MKLLAKGSGTVIVVPAIMTALALLLPSPFNITVSAALLACTLFTIWFFRDPERVPPEDPLAVVSPADGTLRSREIENGNWVFTIVMHGWSVHVNRVPCSGEVIDIQRHPGKHLPVYFKNAQWKNTREDMTLKTEHGVVTVSRLVGIIARRIVTWVQADQHVRTGQRIGMIRFGSLARLLIPEHWALEQETKVGDRVNAGITVFAHIPSGDPT